MKVQRTASAAFTVELETEQEVREEHRRNLAHGALLIPTAEEVAADALLLIALRGPGGEVFVKASVVTRLADGLALAIEGDGDQLLARLLPPAVVEAAGPDTPASPEKEETGRAAVQSAWDRVRGLSPMEKILLAVKADRPDRALLLQDNDPRVLLSLLRNPRLTVDEVGRLAKSTFLNFQIAETIQKTAQWMSSLDVRLALVHNPKTPVALALRILPSLPENEVRQIARAGTNMQLKQAALRRLQGS